MAQFGGVSSVSTWRRVRNILQELQTPPKNYTETQVVNPKKSLLANYETSQDEDMTCDNISVFENNTENIDLDRTLTLTDSVIVSAVLAKRKSFSVMQMTLTTLKTCPVNCVNGW